MAQQHKIDASRVEGKGFVIAFPGFAVALDHAAINQETAVRRLHQKTRSCDLLGGAMKSDLHE